MKQTTFVALAWSGKKGATRRERFLGEMDKVIPWDRLLRLIEPHYYTRAVPLLDGVLVVAVGAVFFAIIEVEKPLRLVLRREERRHAADDRRPA